MVSEQWGGVWRRGEFIKFSLEIGLESRCNMVYDQISSYWSLCKSEVGWKGDRMVEFVMISCEHCTEL